MCYAGLGTDTAGSIRIPAAFCGVSGLMPTFGRVPKSGCVPLGYSLDHLGPLARSARDCAAVLEVIAGEHASDPDCVSAPFDDAVFDVDLSGRTVAVLADQGAQCVEVSLPHWSEMITADMITMGAEARVPPHCPPAALG